MSESRAVRMQLSEAASLGRLRLRSGIEVCVHENVIWLRVKVITDALDAAIRALPGTRFTVLPDGQLVEFGNRAPSGYLPNDPWIDLDQWMRIRAEPASLAGTVHNRITLRFVRGGLPDATNVIVTSVDIWQAYATKAPQIRLDRWAFAINGDGQAVVWGVPSPPITGRRFVERLGVAASAGWAWRPPVDHAVLSELLSLATGDLALLNVDGTWEHIRSEDFVRATRSAVRLSMEVRADD